MFSVNNELSKGSVWQVILCDSLLLQILTPIDVIRL